jgi:Skp family chaperone for outer membrane proteins
MSKGLITFVAIVCIAVVAAFLVYYMKQSADIARYKSDKILEEFKTVDKDLQDSQQKLDSLNKAFFDSLRKAEK